MKLQAREWLSHHAVPLWLNHGVDLEHGGFYEELTLGQPVVCAKRAMVQARQIYTFSMAAQFSLCDRMAALQAIEHGTQFLLKHYVLPSGAIKHSVWADGSECDNTPDLYAQAFALFGFAHAYTHLKDEKFKTSALAILNYLKAERRLKAGGFSELRNGTFACESNAHMHLFEAALTWMQVDHGQVWRDLADEIVDLCVAKLIDPSTGSIAEQFDEEWAVKCNEADQFYFEPGHQYEWAWLFGCYEALTKKDLSYARAQLFNLTEQHGICPKTHAVYDEMWSNFTVKTASSRFWTQCERIKAAIQFGKIEVANESVAVLFRYFETPVQGLWYDRLNKDETFTQLPAKASSFYHIMGALSEYLKG